jgi:hypothetical protein
VAAAISGSSRAVAAAFPGSAAQCAACGEQSRCSAAPHPDLVGPSMKSPRSRANITPYGLDFTEGEPRDELTQAIFPDYPNQEQIITFYSTLGQAVSAWQLVESALYVVYEKSTKPQIQGAASCGFHAIQTFNIKLIVTDAAVRFYLLKCQECLPEWELLYKKSDTKSAQRNKLVHFSTYIMYSEKNENDKIRLEPQV